MENKLLTVEEVAEKLKVCRSWVYKKISAKIIPHTRIGGLLRIKENELTKWIDGHSVSGSLKL